MLPIITIIIAIVTIEPKLHLPRQCLIAKLYFNIKKVL